jgi:hypothetical protein
MSERWRIRVLAFVVLGVSWIAVACGGRDLSIEPHVPADASGSAVVPDGGPDAVAMDGAAPMDAGVGAIGTTTAPDCDGCTFPSTDAAPCAAAASIKIVYPPDTALLPPNLGTLSVQWVPYGASFVRFEVDFTQSTLSPPTDWSIITACATQTVDQQDAASGGCEIQVDPTSWSKIAAANRGGDPVAITVRGTTDGTCASTSEDTIHVSFAPQDLLGTYFYWRSEPGLLGGSGQIWGQTFGDVDGGPGQNLTSPTFGNPVCSGCHMPSLDGTRMLVYPDDDTDPDYGSLAGSYIDLSAWPGAAVPLAENQAPGWTAFESGGTSYVTSNGPPCQATSATTCPADPSVAYPSAVPANGFSLWDADSGTFTGPVPMGAAGTRPTMPDWSVDGTSLVYVQPTAVASWDESQRFDDDHIFGGSLYQAPYMGSGAFGSPAALITSQGENNYYPSFSPDVPASFILFDRAPLDTTVATLTGCSGVPPMATCPNDSFANPAARLMLVANTPGATPVDLQAANGSSTPIAAALSNSSPRFAPFVQTSKGKTLYWITFSSTRDYGLRVLNHKSGMYQCYPSDSYEWPGSVHTNVYSPLCQHPQLWMAPILADGTAPSASDPSGVAFWIPYQDTTTDNHMARWSWKPQPGARNDAGAGCACSAAGSPCGPASGGCGCCQGSGLVCSGGAVCILPTR